MRTAANDTGSDGVRIGVARILTTGPNGTATAGTLYVHGTNAQYADPGTGRHRSRARHAVPEGSGEVDQPVVDRRVNARFPAEAVAARVTLRPGCVLAVVDWSAGGALVQAAKPLRPGTRVHLRVIVRHHTVCLAAHVLRCVVWSLDTPGGVTYRGALKFDQECDLMPEAVLRAEALAVGGERLSHRVTPIVRSVLHRPASATM